MTVLEIAKKDIFDKAIVEAGNKLVVIKFFATWCCPCRIVEPKFLKLANDLTDNVYIKVNVDKGEDIANTFDVKMVPTFVLIKNDKTIATIEGSHFEKLHEAVIKLSV